MLMCITHKLPIYRYFCSHSIAETHFPLESNTGSIELIVKFLHFEDRNTEVSYSGPSMLCKIKMLLQILTEHFNAVHPS
jgi:hypothetical protein